jgi:predicted permease
MDALHGSTPTASETTGAQKTLVIAQAALSVVLLSAAAMLARSLQHLEHQNLGFATDGRYVVSIDSKASNQPQERLIPIFREIERRLRALPGVRSASAALYGPMSGSNWSHDVRIAGQPEPGAGEDVSSAWTRVMPGFFETIGDRIVMGRPIVDADNETASRVAVINEAFARRFFRNRNPIGGHFGPSAGKNAGLYEIVGVAADVRYFPSATHAVRPMYFVPEAQGTTFDDRELESRELWSHALYNVVLWAPGNPPGLEAAVRGVFSAVAPDIVMHGVNPYADIVRRQFTQQEMIASLTWVFGAMGVLLAAVGLYGITAYSVERRTAEIGVRMALGADGASVVRMVLRGAFVQVGVGLALGIPAAIGSGVLIANQLFDVRPWDPGLLACAALVLVAATLVAALIPARRAAELDPMRVLRQ